MRFIRKKKRNWFSGLGSRVLGLGRAPKTENRKPNNGFTLVELAIASSLAAIIALCVYATLSQGIKIWQRASAQVYEEDLNIFLDKIASEIRNQVKFKGMRFFGTQNEIKLVSLVRSNSSQSGLDFNIGEIDYSFQKNSGILTRSQANFSQVYSDKLITDVVTVLKSIKSASFKYYFYDPEKLEYVWLDEWSQEGLPEAVQIELDFEDSLQLSHLTSSVTIPISGWLR